MNGALGSTRSEHVTSDLAVFTAPPTRGGTRAAAGYVDLDGVASSDPDAILAELQRYAPVPPTHGSTASPRRWVTATERAWAKAGRTLLTGRTSAAGAATAARPATTMAGRRGFAGQLLWESAGGGGQPGGGATAAAASFVASSTMATAQGMMSPIRPSGYVTVSGGGGGGGGGAVVGAGGSLGPVPTARSSYRNLYTNTATSGRPRHVEDVLVDRDGQQQQQQQRRRSQKEPNTSAGGERRRHSAYRPGAVMDEYGELVAAEFGVVVTDNPRAVSKALGRSLPIVSAELATEDGVQVGRQLITLQTHTCTHTLSLSLRRV